VSLEDARLFWGHADAIASLARLLRWDDDTTSTSTAASTIASTLTLHPATKHRHRGRLKPNNNRSRNNNDNINNDKISMKNHHYKRKKRHFHHASLQIENVNNKNDDDFEFDLEDEARDKVPPLLPPPTKTAATTDPTKRGRRKRQRRINNTNHCDNNNVSEDQELQECRPSSAATALSSASSSSIATSSYNTNMSISTSNSSNNLDFDDDSMNTNNNKSKKKIRNSSSDRARQKQIDQVIALVRKREAQLSKEQQYQQQLQHRQATPPPVQSALRVPDDITVSWLALKALQTVIIAANDDHHEDDDEEDDGDDDEHSPPIISIPASSSSSISHQQHQQQQQHPKHKKKKKDPMFINNLLRESDSLPHLALALRASCDRAITTHSKALSSMSPSRASRSIGFLQDRIIMLTSMIDTVCCLTPDNRTVLCQGTGLVDYMVRLVAVCCLPPAAAAASVACNDGVDTNEDPSPSTGAPQKHTEELILSCLKAITSLTHENRLAGESLCKERSWCDRYIVASSSESSKTDCGTCGVRTAKSCVGIIFRVLEQMIRKNGGDGNKTTKDKAKPQHQHQLDQKVIYDVRIFCLSILTNAAETGKSARRELAKCTVRVCVDGEEGTTSGEQRPAIQWLASWIVDQTCAFRSSLVALSSSRSNQINGEEEKKRDDEGDLAAGEEESLNTTGNGFLLLACLLKRWKECSNEAPVREMILDEMPQVEGSSKRVQYIIAGLNAFLNFYHVSLDGALSDAIVTPVVKLIDELKQL